MDGNITTNKDGVPDRQRSCTVTGKELKQLLWDTSIGTMPTDHYDEVYPGIILGDW